MLTFSLTVGIHICAMHLQTTTFNNVHMLIYLVSYVAILLLVCYNRYVPGHEKKSGYVPAIAIIAKIV